MDACTGRRIAAPPVPLERERPMVLLAEPETVGTSAWQGRWSDPSLPYRQLRHVLAGSTLLDRYVIVGQVGFGPFKLDEDTALAGLRLSLIHI